MLSIPRITTRILPKTRTHAPITSTQQQQPPPHSSRRTPSSHQATYTTFLSSHAPSTSLIRTSRISTCASSSPSSTSTVDVLRSFHTRSSSSSSSSSSFNSNNNNSNNNTHSTRSFPHIALVITLSSGIIASYIIYQHPTVYAAEENINLEPKKKSRRKKDAPLKNPGPFSKYHEEAKNVYTIHPYSGARFNLGRTLAYSDGQLLLHPNVPNPDKSMNISYSFEMGNPQIPGGAVAGLQLQSRLHGSQLQGTFNSMYHSNGQIMIPFWNDRGQFKTNWQINDQQNACNLELDYAFRSNTTSLALQQLQVLVLSTNQAVTPHWSIGTDLITFMGQKFGANIGVRYKTDQKQPNEIYTATYQTFSEETSLSYIRQVNESTSLATELNVNWRSRESTATIGMMHNHPTYQLNAAVNSDATVAVSLEQRMGSAMAFQICGEMNHVQGESLVGVAFTIQA